MVRYYFVGLNRDGVATMIFNNYRDADRWSHKIFKFKSFGDAKSFYWKKKNKDAISF